AKKRPHNNSHGKGSSRPKQYGKKPTYKSLQSSRKNQILQSLMAERSAKRPKPSRPEGNREAPDNYLQKICFDKGYCWHCVKEEGLPEKKEPAQWRECTKHNQRKR
ncbi:hypothetical protein Vretimale_16725, partial [Volvox reticuliferus]